MFKKIKYIFIVFILLSVVISCDDVLVKETSRTTEIVSSQDIPITSEEEEFTKKYALIIGNADYSQQVALNNPLHDASDLTDMLKKLGFEVQLLKNIQDLRGMEDAIHTFHQKLQQADVALFYYSGHGVQFEGNNYLIPTQVLLRDERDIKFKTLAVDYILEAMQTSQAKVNIVILDACRDNPFAKKFKSLAPSRGLARIEQKTIGSIIMFATAPGYVASDGEDRNGTYTKFLLKHLDTPGIDIYEMNLRVSKDVGQVTQGQQVPYFESNTKEKFCFVECFDMRRLQQDKQNLESKILAKEQALQQIEQQVAQLNKKLAVGQERTPQDQKQQKLKFQLEQERLQLADNLVELQQENMMLNKKLASFAQLEQEKQVLEAEVTRLKEKLETKKGWSHSIDVGAGFGL